MGSISWSLFLATYERPELCLVSLNSMFKCFILETWGHCNDKRDLTVSSCCLKSFPVLMPRCLVRLVLSVFPGSESPWHDKLPTPSHFHKNFGIAESLLLGQNLKGGQFSQKRRRHCYLGLDEVSNNLRGGMTPPSHWTGIFAQLCFTHGTSNDA